jgi:hypothetical protein
MKERSWQGTGTVRIKKILEKLGTSVLMKQKLCCNKMDCK